MYTPAVGHEGLLAVHTGLVQTSRTSARFHGSTGHLESSGNNKFVVLLDDAISSYIDRVLDFAVIFEWLIFANVEVFHFACRSSHKQILRS